MEARVNPGQDRVRSAAQAYCEALHRADVAQLDTLCHEDFQMSAVTGTGELLLWDKTRFLQRIEGRAPFEGEPEYEIVDVDVSGEVMARVLLRVAVPPRVFEDYLGFARLGTEWKLINKLFRTYEGPDLEG